MESVVWEDNKNKAKFIDNQIISNTFAFGS